MSAATSRPRRVVPTCLCCGRLVANANQRQPIHLGCWVEHHSDPTGVWPPDHRCPFTSREAAS